jgi:hypothetical protein
MGVTNAPESGQVGSATAAPAQAPAPQEPTAPAQTTPQVPTSEPTLPTGVSERTSEQFDKLKDSNKKLYEANLLLQQELNRKQQAEQSLQTPVVVDAPKDPKLEQFIDTDPVTGEQFVNEERLKKSIQEAQSRAEKAEKTVQSFVQQQNAREEQRQTEEAFKAYPELDPSNEKFDASLTRRTRAFLIDSMMNPQDYSGKTLSFREAADLAKGQTGQPVAPAPVQPKIEDKKEEGNLAGKEQASFAAQGASSSAQQTQAPSSDTDLVDLQYRSRRGDVWAIAQRLTKIPHTGTPTSKV